MKKLFSIALVFSMLLSFAGINVQGATTDTAQSDEQLYFVSDKIDKNDYTQQALGYIGDADNDKKITIMDVSTIQRYLVKLTQLNVTRELFSNVDRNEKIDITDATEIQRYIAQLTKNSNVGKYLCKMLAHSQKELEMFDEIADVIKEQGKSTTSSSGQTSYYIKGNGTTLADDWHLYSGTYDLRYTDDSKFEGNTGCIIMSYRMYSPYNPDIKHDTQLRIYRGSDRCYVTYEQYDANIKLVEDDYRDAIVQSFTTGEDIDENFGEYLFANEETQSVDEYFTTKETYELFAKPMLDSSIRFINSELEKYTDIRINSLLV